MSEVVIAIGCLHCLSDRRCCLKAGMTDLYVNHSSFQPSVLRQTTGRNHVQNSCRHEVMCQSFGVWFVDQVLLGSQMQSRFCQKSQLQSSVVPQAQVTCMCAWQVGTAQVCWYSAHQVATRLLSCKTVFRKGQAWLTSQSQLCQEGARLCGYTQARCVDVTCEDKPLPSHLDTQAPSALPCCPTLVFSSSPPQHLAWVRWSP